MVKTRIYLLLCTCVYFFFPLNINCQEDVDTIPDFKVLTIAKSVVENGNQQSNELYTHTLKRLQAIDRYEKKLLKKMPSATRHEATQRLDDINEKIRQIESWQNDPKKLLEQVPGGPYISWIDSLQTMFSFAMPKITNHELLQQAQENLTLLKAQLGQSGELESWMEARRETWISLLKPGGLTDKLKLPAEFTKWQQEAHTYKAQIQHYRETIQDGSKLEKEALRWLNKLPAFSEFMSKHGELARLFGPPSGSAATGASGATPIPGLQTRESMAQLLVARFGNDFLESGGGLQQSLQQGMEQMSAQAQNPLNQLPGWDEIMENGGLYLDKMNTELTPQQKELAEQKALPLRKRFEVGWNLQSATRIQDFPAIRDVGLSLGYKMNPRSVIGIGIAYKFALGESWKDVELTHEGVGLRSFLDWRISAAGSKLLQNFWITVGFEMNYWERIANGATWKDLAWQQSGLIGLTKTIKFKKTEGKVQMLYEIINPQQANAVPIYFRISKNF